jgi:hypothetical protein
METDYDFRSRILAELKRQNISATLHTHSGKELDDLGFWINIVRKQNKGESMAKLSELTVATAHSTITNKAELNTLRGETIMTTNNTGTLRVINLTLVDNNPNLKVEGKVVFQKLNHMTEHNDERTIQQILMSGAVAEALEAHNAKRVKVVDKEIQRATGRDVKLEEVEIFNLDWQVVRVA